MRYSCEDQVGVVASSAATVLVVVADLAPLLGVVHGSELVIPIISKNI